MKKRHLLLVLMLAFPAVLVWRFAYMRDTDEVEKNIKTAVHAKDVDTAMKALTKVQMYLHKHNLTREVPEFSNKVTDSLTALDKASNCKECKACEAKLALLLVKNKFYYKNRNHKMDYNVPQMSMMAAPHLGLFITSMILSGVLVFMVPLILLIWGSHERETQEIRKQKEDSNG